MNKTTTLEEAEYKEAQDYEPSAFVVPLAQFLGMKQQRDEARELAQELLDALSKLVALNAKMTSDDCTYERAYYCYYKGHYDKWKLATEALAKAKEGAK